MAMSRGLPISAATLLDAMWKGQGLETRSSELNQKKLGRVLADVRMRGAVAAQQQYVALQSQYAVAYNQYLAAQETLKPHREAAEKLLGQVDDQLRRAMEQAAKYRLQNEQKKMTQQAQEQDEFIATSAHPKYAAIMQGLNETHRSWVDKIVFPFFLLQWQLEEAENALWVKHSAITIAQEVNALWLYEGQAVQMQLEAMKDEEQHEALKAEAHERFLQHRLQEIRAKNKDRKKKLRAERYKDRHHDHSPSGSPPRSRGKESSVSQTRSSATVTMGCVPRRERTKSRTRCRRSSSATTETARPRSSANAKSKVNAAEWL
ncbi:hypothetical protein BESB_013290 [Besnoitia besnoiti]|uniref:Uncharacterized protein n=1 Tax=Besnoitia besnoiti TaxID=94643 RepID=A0A2A9MAS4_BESBE|nr:hypothetical protein BESB_013290 [Besnoitia besnoiti]PFH32717.1 hypothetical protein BESB_013290 [Besnoitia besnoiti]